MHQASTQEVHFQGNGDIQAWLSRPSDAGRYPAITLLHGRNGPSDSFRDVGARFAEEGIVALAVNYMTNGDPPNPEVMPTVSGALELLRAQSDVATDQIALGGYCRGGGLTYLGLTRFPGFSAGIAWHGAIPPEAQSVQVPVIILHGVSDPAVSIDKVFELAKYLNEQGNACQLKAYSGCKHAFTLPGGGDYQAEAADDAFREAVLFLRRRYGLPAGEVGPLVREGVAP
ncbi:MAG TPA: dienelactone hydrolase family protein [Chloroflexota bacterium]|nr:dienelactone hydrolase family protein [Chloroflexota bacterium]